MPGSFLWFSRQSIVRCGGASPGGGCGSGFDLVGGDEVLDSEIEGGLVGSAEGDEEGGTTEPALGFVRFGEDAENSVFQGWPGG